MNSHEKSVWKINTQDMNIQTQAEMEENHRAISQQVEYTDLPICPWLDAFSLSLILYFLNGGLLEMYAPSLKVCLRGFWKLGTFLFGTVYF